MAAITVVFRSRAHSVNTSDRTMISPSSHTFQRVAVPRGSVPEGQDRSKGKRPGGQEEGIGKRWKRDRNLQDQGVVRPGHLAQRPRSCRYGQEGPSTTLLLDRARRFPRASSRPEHRREELTQVVHDRAARDAYGFEEGVGGKGGCRKRGQRREDCERPPADLPERAGGRRIHPANLRAHHRFHPMRTHWIHDPRTTGRGRP